MNVFGFRLPHFDAFGLMLVSLGTLLDPILNKFDTTVPGFGTRVRSTLILQRI